MDGTFLEQLQAAWGQMSEGILHVKRITGTVS